MIVHIEPHQIVILASPDHDREFIEEIGVGGKAERVGWIVPSSPLRFLFFVLVRLLGGKKGREWTRRWKGPWLLILKPLPFEKREEALKTEEEIWRFLRLLRS